LNFKIDRNNNFLFLISNEIGQNERHDPVYLMIKDLNFKDKIILETEIFDHELKGIFVSDQYILIDGHLYFNNNVIKLRYELMQQYPNTQEFQSIFFNYYSQILHME
jgi:uncharacterized protein YwqG